MQRFGFSLLIFLIGLTFFGAAGCSKGGSSSVNSGGSDAHLPVEQIRSEELNLLQKSLGEQYHISADERSLLTRSIEISDPVALDEVLGTSGTQVSR